MQLNEILEENSIKTISQKTKISEVNLEAIFAGNFESLQKTKALGFIAIIEREYHADLANFREQALEYYGSHEEDNSYSTRHYYLDEEKKGKSKLLIFIVFGLLIYASWYFLTQYDKKNLSGLISFIDEKTIGNFINDKEVNTVDATADLSIAKVTVTDDAVEPAKEETDSTEDLSIVKVAVEDDEVAPVEVEEETNSTNVSNVPESLVEEPQTAIEQNDEEEPVNTLESVLIVPVNKLWFGVVNIDSKEREHFSIDQGYTLDIKENGWLVATSSAPFSLVQGDETQDFSDAREHYFKIDKNGIVMLSKSEYVAQGGWHQW